ncbi:hypothetical protein EVAR_25860_1 [Eumeta japonica]|uniref:Uncharacterized protein n=1 Tax=Eumeta variegata TaxID=151549 RepID=A0A4C1X977_EUMVA|nr:hypothetical protein EVAR_25860_1 [Eumeta japonica]
MTTLWSEDVKFRNTCHSSALSSRAELHSVTSTTLLKKWSPYPPRTWASLVQDVQPYSIEEVTEIHPACIIVRAAPPHALCVDVTLQDYFVRPSLDHCTAVRHCPDRRSRGWIPVGGNSVQRWRESQRSTSVDVHSINRMASRIRNLAMGAKSELGAFKNINKDVKEFVIMKLQDISALALLLDESCSRYVVELEREKARRAAELETAERRLHKIKQTNTQVGEVPQGCSEIGTASGELRRSGGKVKVKGAAVKTSGPTVRPETSHTLIVASKFENHTAEQDIVASLRTQNRHLSEGLDCDKVRARVCYGRRARNDLECHLVFEVSVELYQHLIKAGYVYVGLQRRPIRDQYPLVQCSRCLCYTVSDSAKTCPRGARTAAGSTLAKHAGLKKRDPKVHKLCEGRLRRHRTWAI